MSITFKTCRLACAGAMAAMLACAPGAHAGAIPFDAFLQFSFESPGGAVIGCDPADPAGPFCIASSGTPTQFLDAPAWTFSAPAGATLTVLDAFLSGDRFEIFDFGVSLGSTSGSSPQQPVDCGDDPLDCLANPFVDSAVFALGAGLHSLTLVSTLVPNGFGGSGYLRVTAAALVPEPASLALVLGGLAAACGSRRRNSRIAS